MLRCRVASRGIHFRQASQKCPPLQKSRSLAFTKRQREGIIHRMPDHSHAMESGNAGKFIPNYVCLDRHCSQSQSRYDRIV